MSRVVIVSGIPITRNPRVVKEADTLAANGFDVHVLTSIQSADQAAATERRICGKPWKSHFVINCNGTNAERLMWNVYRAKKAILRNLTPLWRKRFEAEIFGSISALRAAALRLCGDHYSLHNEPGMFVAEALADKGLPFCFDLEDWHSENMFAGYSSKYYETLKEKECFVIKNSRFVTTTSTAMSREIAKYYEVANPEVVYNSFPEADFEGQSLLPIKSEVPRIVWFSQTIGPGRGLELLATAAALTHNRFEVHLRGRVSNCYRQNLLSSFSRARNVRLFFHGLCDHSELNSWLAGFDVGFASELPRCLNADLTISNKILQYMQAGLPVIATDTQGQLEVAQYAGEGIVVVPHDSPDVLANAIDGLAKNLARCTEFGKLATRAFQTYFSWPICASRLQRLFGGLENADAELTHRVAE
jgi:glycosyltransferase involved in cell wall biosynthesis